MNKLLRSVLIFSVVLIVLSAAFFLSCFTTLDESPYEASEFYKKELAEINTLHPIADSGTVQAGWARASLVPPFGTPIAIDDQRGGKHFEGVHDTVYVRAFVFKSGNKKVAFVSADLLIVPPAVSALLDSSMQAEGYSSSNLFYSATHAHSSIGAWQNSFVGEKFAGKYDERVPAFIAGQFKQAILEAEKNTAPVKIGFAAVPTQKLVFNRLVGDSGEVDSLLRIVKLVKDNGEEAAIVTFAAHATVYHQGMMQLSGDWPSLMMQKLQSAGHFYSFSAGAVGSQGPYPFSQVQEDELNYMAQQVSALVKQYVDSMPVAPLAQLEMHHLPLYLREPNLRMAPKTVVRPWLFYKLFGNYPAHVNLLQLNRVVFVGMPCDFSGELVNEIDAAGQLYGLQPVVTGFNGAYIGYITDDKWYGLNTYETRLMGWFGPGNGSYLSEVAIKSLEKLK
ncbi:MAG: neutral/alkaline non-lysosomal ceramidase N-terminal domain-containing protein [Chitinophagales bacterium]